MLPKENRLSQKKDFDKVRQEGKNYTNPLFGLLVFDRKDSNPPRFGFIISTRLSQKATERNRARRIAKEATRQLLQRVKLGFDAVFLGKRIILGQRLSIVYQEMLRTLQEARLLR